MLRERLGSGPPSPVQAFMDHGEDFIVERTLPELVRRMNALTGEDLIDLADLERQIVARDREVANPYAKDAQITAIHGARAYFADKRHPRRRAAPDPRPGRRARWSPCACRSSPASRSAGSRRTSTRACSRRPASRCPGLYAAGEVAGFGGGGMHGYRSLEGTFLGGCLFSGRVAGRAMSAATA